MAHLRHDVLVTAEDLAAELASDRPPVVLDVRWRLERPDGWDEYARIIHDLLTGLGKGIDVDFADRRLVGVGHSMGAIALYALFKLPALSSRSPILRY